MFTALLTATLLWFEQPVEQSKGYIWLGDSRFVGMNNACHMDEEDNNWVVAKVGKGLKWCIDDAMPEIEDIVQDNPDITEWVLISGLGVNDSYNVKSYMEFYDSLDGFDLILLSVNPMEKSKCEKYGYDFGSLQRGADTFNNVLTDSDYTVVDTSGYMYELGFSTVDGIHYTKDTYETIYSFICSFLEETYKE